MLLVDVGGAGVALESDAPADGDGSAIGLDGGGLELVEDDEFIDEDWSEGNLARASGDRRRVTTLDFGCFMLDFEVEVDAAAGDSVVMIYGVEVVGGGERGGLDSCRSSCVFISCGRRKGWVQCKRPWRTHGGRWR